MEHVPTKTKLKKKLSAVPPLAEPQAVERNTGGEARDGGTEKPDVGDGTTGITRGGRHLPTKTKNVGEWKYSPHNRSAAFQCPICGKQERANTNYLGYGYHLECDGIRFHRVPNKQH